MQVQLSASGCWTSVQAPISVVMAALYGALFKTTAKELALACIPICLCLLISKEDPFSLNVIIEMELLFLMFLLGVTLFG